MGINLISPSTSTTAFLITDTVHTTGGSSDSIPQMTKVGGNTVSAALEIQSTLGAFLLPRMTSAQIAALATPAPGMSAYNTTINSVVNYTAQGGIAGASGWASQGGIASGTLTTAQVVAMHGASILLLPAPGAGFAIIVSQFIIETVSTGHTPYVNGGTVYLQYSANGAVPSGTNIATPSAGISAAAVLAAANNIALTTGVIGDTTDGLATTGIVINSPVCITNTTAAFANGAGTNINWYISYKILPIV